MKQCVTTLRVEEPARFNPDRLERLCTEMGELRAEDEVAKALETISVKLQEIGEISARRGVLSTERSVRVLAETSEHIGMSTLARVARDVLTCLDQRDIVALAATHSRLARVGDRSIHALWDLEGLSG